MRLNLHINMQPQPGKANGTIQRYFLNLETRMMMTVMPTWISLKPLIQGL